MPHVQSYLLATDKIGLKVMSEEGALDCYDNLADTVKYSELGGSEAIFKHNYTIDTLMLRYQGVDWRNTDNHHCNMQINPATQYMYDGISLNPLEILFIKVKQLHVEAEWAQALSAVKYDEWKRTGLSNIHDNYFMRVRIHDLIRKTRAQYKYECFNATAYENGNYDLKALHLPKQNLYDHYVGGGQFEARAGVQFDC